MKRPSGKSSLNAALLIKALMIFCTVYTVGALTALFISGDTETKSAFANGQRYLIYLADGRVESAGTQAAKPAEPVKTPQAKDAPKDAPKNALPDIPKVTEEIPPSPPIAPPGSDDQEIKVIQATNPLPEPKEELIEKQGEVMLPKVAKDLSPWTEYSKPYKRPDENPLVAIIITGLGQSGRVTEQALKMHENISLSISPYARRASSWAHASRMAGHEVFVDMPMQPDGFPNDDPGPHAMLVAKSNTENAKQLIWILSRFQGYVGVVTPVSEVVSNNTDAYKPIPHELSKRGLLLIAGRSITQKETEDEIIASNVGFKTADVWIDEELNEFTIQARLATLEQIARKKGHAIGIAGAYPITLRQLESWTGRLADHGINLVPASYLAKID